MRPPMTPERRDELVRRREQLKEQRRREVTESHRRAFIASLDEAGVSYSVADEEPLVSWITRRFRVDAATSIVDSRDKERWRCIAPDVLPSPALLKTLAAEQGLGDPEVAVVYADAAFPSLKVRYSELYNHADIILDVVWQTWVFDPASDWIIEFHHDLGWFWGRPHHPPPRRTGDVGG